MKVEITQKHLRAIKPALSELAREVRGNTRDRFGRQPTLKEARESIAVLYDPFFGDLWLASAVSIPAKLASPEAEARAITTYGEIDGPGVYDVPEKKGVPERHELILDLPDWADIYRNLHASMANEDVRYYLNGLCFHEDEAVTTDGRRLAVYDMGDRKVEEDLIVPRYVVQAVKRAKHVWIFGAGEGRIRVESEDFSIYGERIDGQFPDYHRVMRREEDPVGKGEKAHPIKDLRPHGFVDFLKAAKKVKSDRQSPRRWVILYPQNGRLFRAHATTSGGDTGGTLWGDPVPDKAPHVCLDMKYLLDLLATNADRAVVYIGEGMEYSDMSVSAYGERTIFTVMVMRP